MKFLIRIGIITASYLYVLNTEGMDIKTAWFLGGLALFVTEKIE